MLTPSSPLPHCHPNESTVCLHAGPSTRPCMHAAGQQSRSLVQESTVKMVHALKSTLKCWSANNTKYALRLDHPWVLVNLVKQADDFRHQLLGCGLFHPRFFPWWQLYQAIVLTKGQQAHLPFLSVKKKSSFPEKLPTSHTACCIQVALSPVVHVLKLLQPRWPRNEDQVWGAQVGLPASRFHISVSNRDNLLIGEFAVKDEEAGLVNIANHFLILFRLHFLYWDQHISPTVSDWYCNCPLAISQ